MIYLRIKMLIKTKNNTYVQDTVIWKKPLFKFQ